jgi:hypothetical protein
MNEMVDFWVLIYENRRREHIQWALVFALMTVLCIGFWVFYLTWYALLVAALEYACFLGHLTMGLENEEALENERSYQ